MNETLQSNHVQWDLCLLAAKHRIATIPESRVAENFPSRFFENEAACVPDDRHDCVFSWKQQYPNSKRSACPQVVSDSGFLF